MTLSELCFPASHSLAMWHCCCSHQVVGSSSLASGIWAALVLYFDQWNVVEGLLCKFLGRQKHCSFCAHPLRLLRPLCWDPASLLENETAEALSWQASTTTCTSPHLTFQSSPTIQQLWLQASPTKELPRLSLPRTVRNHKLWMFQSTVFWSGWLWCNG